MVTVSGVIIAILFGMVPAWLNSVYFSQVDDQAVREGKGTILMTFLHIWLQGWYILYPRILNWEL